MNNIAIQKNAVCAPVNRDQNSFEIYGSAQLHFVMYNDFNKDVWQCCYHGQSVGIIWIGLKYFVASYMKHDFFSMLIKTGGIIKNDGSLVHILLYDILCTMLTGRTTHGK